MDTNSDINPQKYRRSMDDKNTNSYSKRYTYFTPNTKRDSVIKGQIPSFGNILDGNLEKNEKNEKIDKSDEFTKDQIINDFMNNAAKQARNSDFHVKSKERVKSSF